MRQIQLSLIFLFCVFSQTNGQDSTDKHTDPLTQLAALYEGADTVVVIKGDSGYPPFQFLNDQGEPDGFDIELTMAVAEAVGINVQIEMDEWANVVESFNNGETDVLMGVFRTAERESKMDFSIPHFITSYVFVVREGDNISHLSELTDKEVFAMRRDVGEMILKRHLPSKQIDTVTTSVEAIQRVANGEGFGAFVSRVHATYTKEKYNLDNIIINEKPEWKLNYGMVVQKGNQALLSELNVGLTIIKENGTYDKIYNKWFDPYVITKEDQWEKVSWIMLWIGIPLLVFAIASLLWGFVLHRKVETHTSELKKELNVHNRIESELLKNENDLKERNAEYRQLNEQLINYNNEISRINTELKMAKQDAERNDQLKTAFLANMSHEIRTPMNGVVGFAELLRHTELSSEEQNEYISVVLKSGLQLMHIIDDILEISKIENGQLLAVKEKILIDKLLEELHQSHNLKAESKGLKLIVDKQSDPLFINSDYEKIKRVYEHLISNSIKFTEQGEIHIGCLEQDGSFEFYVSDTGIGIEKKFYNYIFERFGQVEQLNQQKSGTGLGLSIAKSLVEILGGTLSVKSAVGEGTRFEFRLNHIQ